MTSYFPDYEKFQHVTESLVNRIKLLGLRAEMIQRTLKYAIFQRML